MSACPRCGSPTRSRRCARAASWPTSGDWSRGAARPGAGEGDGRGGMGRVFRARHLRLDRPVAVKLLRPGAPPILRTRPLAREAARWPCCPTHMVAVHDLAARGRQLPGHGAGPGRHAGRRSPLRCATRWRCSASWARAGRRPRGRDRSPRHQARERPSRRGRAGPGHRLRHRPPGRSPAPRSADPPLAGAGDARLHGPRGAGRGPARPAHGRVRGGGAAGADDHRPPARREPGRPPAARWPRWSAGPPPPIRASAPPPRSCGHALALLGLQPGRRPTTSCRPTSRAGSARWR